MKNKIDIDWGAIFLVFVIVLVVLLVLGSIATSIYCFVTYGGKPINEIPSWAFVFMFGGR